MWCANSTLRNAYWAYGSDKIMIDAKEVDN